MYSLVGLNSNNTKTRSHKLRWEKRLPKYDPQSETTTDRRDKWDKLSKYRCAKLVASYPRRLEAVIAAKGASTKY
uniref:Uncharacterized protein n=1 Tax=Salmo trutta TaxID=8032 RepID=A0A673Y5V4_SALTR